MCLCVSKKTPYRIKKYLDLLNLAKRDPSVLLTFVRSKYFFQILKFYSMKCFSTLIGFFLMGNNLVAQNIDDSTRLQLAREKAAKQEKKSNKHAVSTLENANFSFGIGAISTQGTMKNYLKPIASFGMSFEVHKKYYFSCDMMVAPTRLADTLVDKTKLLPRDTSLTIATMGASFGYEFWRSKRTSLYFFGSLGYSSLTVGNNQSNTSNTSNSREQKDTWLVSSFAPSIGFFFEFRQPVKIQNACSQNYNYWRLKFAANPRWFKAVGEGVFYDMSLYFSMNYLETNKKNAIFNSK